MIKISSFSSDINRKMVLSERNKAFLSEIEENLGERIIPADISDYEADLKLIYIASGGSEGKFLNAFKSLRAPYYLLTSGTDNSLAASLEILTWLNMNDLEGEVLHGDCAYIAARIKAIISGKNENGRNGKASLSTFSKADLGGRYAVVGKPSDWLIASVPDYEELRKKLGTELIDIPMKELLDGFSNEKPISDELSITDFSEVYLFFDYDFQNKNLELEELNSQLREMLEFFSDETDNGKLYVSYPMIESIRYTKELPDKNYVNYVVSRTDCHDFKRLAAEFSYYENFDYILFKDNEVPTKERFLMIKNHWEYLTRMNVCKANYIISGSNNIPKQKEDINQLRLFTSQKEKYVDILESVAVLNSFPLFLYEYLK